MVLKRVPVPEQPSISEHQCHGRRFRLEISTCVIDLHFKELANGADRRFFNSVPTSLQLPSEMVDGLRQLAARQLADNTEFRRLVRDLGGAIP
jgi:hypothetical protein